eukprot:COSAG02_NODE_33731_length_495_cov_1.199495_1_plen_83_part_10
MASQAVLTSAQRSMKHRVKEVLSAFARHSTEKGQGKMEYCRFCLQRFSTTYKGKTAEQKLQEHLDIGCRQVSDVKQIMPTEEE